MGKQTRVVMFGSLHLANRPPAIWTPKLANMNMRRTKSTVTCALEPRTELTGMGGKRKGVYE